MAPQKAVAHWTDSDTASWFCFACQSTGNVKMLADIDEEQ